MKKKYKVFISFKNSAELNKNAVTEETAIARRLWENLERNAVATFYSPESVENDSQYNAEISKALMQADVFVLIATRAEHINSPQVKKEILNFDHLCRSGKKDENKMQSFAYLTTGCRMDDVSEDLFLTVDMMTKAKSEDDLLDRILKRIKNVGQVKSDIDKNDLPYFVSKQAFSDSNGSSTELQIGSVIDGKYEVLQKIGQGGMSEVYLTMDKRLNKLWAIKNIRFTNDSKQNEVIRSSLKDEFALIRKLSHPCIPNIVDAIEYENRIIVVMDYIEGESVQEILESGKLELETILSIGKQLCDTLSYLHRQTPQIVYRDLKPRNIILRPDGKVALIDFGIAREYKAGNLEDTVPLGTRGFAAPEQYGGRGQSDGRTDIYAFGMTLYHMVTGISPAECTYGVDYWEVENVIIRNIIIKCTEQHPDNRYQTADELLRDLEKVNDKSLLVKMDLFFRGIRKSFPDRGGKNNKQIPGLINMPEENIVVDAPVAIEVTDELQEEQKRYEAFEETTLLWEKAKPCPQPLSICVCSTSGFIDEREHVLYVYVFNKWAIDDIKKYIYKNSEIKKVCTGNVFQADLYAQQFDISVISDTLQFQKQSTESGFGYRCWKFVRNEVKGNDKTHWVEITVLCEELDVLEDTTILGVQENNFGSMEKLRFAFPDRR